MNSFMYLEIISQRLTLPLSLPLSLSLSLSLSLFLSSRKCLKKNQICLANIIWYLLYLLTIFNDLVYVLYKYVSGELYVIHA